MTIAGRLLLLARPHALLLGLALFFSFGALGAGIGLMGMSGYLISKAAFVSGFTAVALIVTGVRTLAISRAVCRYCERYSTHLVTFQILTTLRVWFYTAVEPLAPARLQGRRSGDLLARITADIDTLDQTYIRGLVTPVAGLLAILLAASILTFFDPRLGLATLLLLLGCGLGLPLLQARLSRRFAVEQAATRGDLSVAMLDMTQGLADSKAFGAERSLFAEGQRLDARLAASQRREGLMRAACASISAMAAVLAAVVVLVLAVPQVTSRELDGIYLATLVLVAVASFEAAQVLASSIECIQMGVAAGRRLFDVIDQAPPAETATGANPATHSIAFRDVHFAYEDSQVLSDLSIEVPDGGRLYVTGASGSGKSTLINLLLRFWDPQAGSIAIGGQDLRDMSTSDLRALFAVVPQNPYLFNTTVRDNLLVADGDASDLEMEAACRRAQLHETIMSFPEGYNTRIGDNGFRLSGGERQRLAIARALLKDAPILLLDEALTHLDDTTAAAVWGTLEQEMTRRTTLILTHDQSIISPGAAVLELH